MKWPKLIKSYVNSMPAQKNIQVPKHFMAFLRTLVIALTIHVRIIRAVVQCRYLQLIKSYSQHYKICTLPLTMTLLIRWRRGEKSNCLAQMNIGALRLIIVEHDPVNVIFTPFLL